MVNARLVHEVREGMRDADGALAVLQVTALAADPAGDAALEIEELDPLTGELLPPEELRFRARVLEDARRGLIAVDADYESLRLDIHKPLGGESGALGDQRWELARDGLVLQLPLMPRDQGQIAEADIVNLVQYALGDYAALLMHHLFAIANDPPYYRRPDIQVHVSTLLDRMGYKRDSRGLHYSSARKRLTKTLLALKYLDIQVVRRGPNRRGGKTTTGFVSSLLTDVGFVTNEDTKNLTLQEIFAQGLPEVVQLSISRVWYAGVRQHDLRPGTHYKLLPRPTAETSRATGPVRRGRRPKAVELLRPYIQHAKEEMRQRGMSVTKAMLLEIANITNKNVTMAGKTLCDALERLSEDGSITDYAIRSSPAGDVVKITW